MNLETTAFSPTLTFLSETDREKIYHAALEVLEHTGMSLQHDGAVKLLKDAGCRQDANRLVTIPATLVEKADLHCAASGMTHFCMAARQ